jgi:hypothetical protein
MSKTNTWYSNASVQNRHMWRTEIVAQHMKRRIGLRPSRAKTRHQRFQCFYFDSASLDTTDKRRWDEINTLRPRITLLMQGVAYEALAGPLSQCEVDWPKAPKNFTPMCYGRKVISSGSNQKAPAGVGRTDATTVPKDGSNTSSRASASPEIAVIHTSKRRCQTTHSLPLTSLLSF